MYTRVLTEEERIRLVNNIAGHLQNANPMIQTRTIELFTKVSEDFGARLRTQLGKAMSGYVKTPLPRPCMRFYPKGGFHCCPRVYIVYHTILQYHDTLLQYGEAGCL
jgi:hypothetical protein